MATFGDLEVVPLRSLDDFLLESARFQLPNVKNVERWVNRVLNNLLYYQTNYFLMAAVIFSIVGVMNPKQMMVGFLAMVVAATVFIYVTNNRYELKRFKQDNPMICFFIILAMGYCLVYLIGSVVVFLFGIALPLLAIILHASLRMRNVKNKITNKIEFIGLKRTPMGLFLEQIGLEQEAGS